jgi:uncharacterized protein (UPF0210 family)
VDSAAVIRTLTLGIGAAHPIADRTIGTAVSRLRRAEAAFHEAGHEVQTVRLTTRPVFDDLADRPETLRPYARRLQSRLDELGIDHFSLGPMPVARPDFPLDDLARIADLLPEVPAISCAAHLATARHGIRMAAALPLAHTIVRLAERTDAGVGNFRFAVLACVGPGHPFFPASYHAGATALTIGLQGAGLVTDALAECKGLDPAAVTDRVRDRIVAAATPVVRLGQGLARQFRIGFGGIDLSPAPSVQASIGEALEHAVGGRFGSPGTVAVVGAITAALRSTGLPVCGYNGLMLPVMEDAVLAREWAAGRIGLHQLLAYSAICGTGLDTVPLPGDTPVEDIAGLLLDLATMATRLNKPLSARLFPLPGILAGDRTAFASPYLINLTLPAA